MSAEPTRLAQALAALVPVGQERVPFGEVTAQQAREQSASLREVGSFGPLARVAKVALAWAQLAGELERAGVHSVAGLEEKTVLGFAESLWVLPPEGGLI